MILLLILLVLSGCSKSEVVLTPLTKDSDTIGRHYRPRPPKVDTARVEIVFDVNINDWQEHDF